jgi:hypothetical protein
VTIAYTIDRATFRTLVDDALRRIPTASRGNWTLHAPVDPGITLVELFAWLLEQRSFWADQVTAPLVRAVMALFGDTMRTARPAGTAITFAPELEPDPSRAFTPHAQVSRRTAMSVPETELVFTLHQSVLALAFARYATPPAVPIIKLAGDLDPAAEEDLRTGRPLEILSAGGGPASVELGLVLAAGRRVRAGVDRGRARHQRSPGVVAGGRPRRAARDARVGLQDDRGRVAGAAEPARRHRRAAPLGHAAVRAAG